MKREKIKIEEGLGKADFGPEKLTMLLDSSHIRALREISEVTRLPMSKIAGLALDDFLQKVKWQDEPAVAPIDPRFIERRIQLMRADGTQK